MPIGYFGVCAFNLNFMPKRTRYPLGDEEFSLFTRSLFWWFINNFRQRDDQKAQNVLPAFIIRTVMEYGNYTPVCIRLLPFRVSVAFSKRVTYMPNSSLRMAWGPGWVHIILIQQGVFGGSSLENLTPR